MPSVNSKCLDFADARETAMYMSKRADRRPNRRGPDPFRSR